jgi:lysophospholipid acyltransferase (LPLAT)-like uncharacterized protein
MLSIATGALIQPVTFSTARGRVLGSWDRFLLPWPFGRGVMIWGEPLTPPAGDDPVALERYLVAIEERLTAVTRRADELCGRVPVPPDPPAPREPSREGSPEASGA